MHLYTAIIDWQLKKGADFRTGAYSREHSWEFDGGVKVPASSSPTVVPLPFSNPSCVDPEEAFVASVSSCHMLWFLSLAAKAGWQISKYRDKTTGVMTKNESGMLWISEIRLNPEISYKDTDPEPQQEEELHAEAHHQCFIANSIRTKILISKRT